MNLVSAALEADAFTTKPTRSKWLGPYLHFKLIHLLKPPHWPSGKVSASRAEDPRFRIPLVPGFFRGRVIPVT